MEGLDEEFKLSRDLIELQRVTKRSNGKIIVNKNLGSVYKDAIVKVLIVCKTNMFSVREAMLVLATCTVMDTKT